MCLVWNRRAYITRGSLIAIGGALSLLFILATVHVVMSLCMLFLDVLTATNMADQFLYYDGRSIYLTLASKGVWIVAMIISDSLVVSI
jgi:hypothetical protein